MATAVKKEKPSPFSDQSRCKVCFHATQQLGQNCQQFVFSHLTRLSPALIILLLPLFYSSVRVLMGSPLLPSSPLKYKRAFIGGGRQEKVKHGMTARSYLKIACALR